MPWKLCPHRLLPTVAAIACSVAVLAGSDSRPVPPGTAVLEQASPAQPLLAAGPIAGELAAAGPAGQRATERTDRTGWRGRDPGDDRTGRERTRAAHQTLDFISYRQAIARACGTLPATFGQPPPSLRA
ncbi:MAG TPA: hypothetical protein VK936_09425 [Longimicrobiales bacterium]|nr:hypothetical protein [Longimicrobiales bacterium]